MIRPIPATKKETRILGLDTCNEELTVGVVSRGGLYLDGLISFRPDFKKASKELATRIIDSAYFPELRAVMLHSQDDRGGPHSMKRITNLPTVIISEYEPRHRRGYKAFHSSLGLVWVKTRLEPTILKRILVASWTAGRLPEPLRVAHLLAELDLPEIKG